MTELEDKKQAEESERLRKVKELRKTRIPVGVPTMSLDYPAREGYARRVVCDRHGRLEKFQRAGWSFVMENQMDEKSPATLKVSTRESIDGRVGQVVGTHKDNTQMYGYLMEIPRELYDEDQAVKMESIDALEAGLKQGRMQGSEELETVRSTPIKIDQKGRRGGRPRKA